MTTDSAPAARSDLWLVSGAPLPSAPSSSSGEESA